MMGALGPSAPASMAAALPLCRDGLDPSGTVSLFLQVTFGNGVYHSSRKVANAFIRLLSFNWYFRSLIVISMLGLGLAFCSLFSIYSLCFQFFS